MTLPAFGFTRKLLKINSDRPPKMISRIVLPTPKRIAVLLTCVIALLIGALTLIPLAAPQGVPGNDKINHVIAFAVLMLPLAILSPRALIWLLPAAIAYGALIEIIQPYTGRSREWQDFQADVVGVLIGVALGLAIWRLVPARYWRPRAT